MSRAIDSALEQITTAIADLRSLITDLRPAALDELGTKPALESLVARFVRQSDLEIELEVDLACENGDADQRHAPELEATVYRLVQEALNNIVKHARAQRVEIALGAAGGAMELTIRDDGVGFDIANTPRGRWGMTTMRERAEAAGGELKVDSAPGRGTRVTVKVPL
jgi:signal transduction histidine kinase